MRSDGVEAEATVTDLTGALAVLEATMRKAPRASKRRVTASDDSRSIDEGLAVLECYVGIADKRVRQAILDVLAAATEERSA